MTKQVQVMPFTDLNHVTDCLSLGEISDGSSLGSCRLVSRQSAYSFTLVLLAGTPEDKLRLFLIHYLCTPTMTQVG